MPRHRTHSVAFKHQVAEEYLAGESSHGLAKRRRPLLSNNGDLSIAAALAGLGVMVSPCFLCGSHLADGRIEAVLQDWMPPPGGIQAVYPHSRHLSAKVRAFVDFLVERLGPQPTWEAARQQPLAR